MLFSGSVFGQYFIETYVGRQGPKPGTPLRDAYIDSWGLAIGPNGNVYYYSPTQLIELDAAKGVIGRVLGPADLRFDLAAPGSDRDFYIDAITVDIRGNIYLLDDGNYRVLRIAPDGTMAARAIPKYEYTKFPGQIAADSTGSVYWTGSSRELQRLDFESGAASVVLGDTGCFEAVPATCSASAVAVDPQDDTLYFLVGNLIRKRDASSHELSTVTDVTSKLGTYELAPNLVAAPDGTLLLPGNLGIHRIDPKTRGISAIASGKELFTPDLWIPTRRGVAQDSNGTIYYTNPERIGTVDDASGTVTPFAGNGQRSFTASRAPADDLQFNSDSWGRRMAAALDGTLFIVEPRLYQIRIVDTATRLTWAVPVYPPWDMSLAVDRDGLLYFATGCQVNRLDPQTGKTQAFVGNADCTGFPNRPVEGLTFDVERGSLYVLADSVRKVNIDTGEVVAVVDSTALEPMFPFYGYSGYFSTAQMATDSANNLYIHRGGYGGIAKATPDGVASLLIGDTSLYANGTGLYNETANRLDVKDLSASTDGSAMFISLGDSIHRVDLATGRMTRIAGSPRLDLPIDSGDGGPALEARFSTDSLTVTGDSILIGTQFLIRRIYLRNP